MQSFHVKRWNFDYKRQAIFLSDLKTRRCSSTTVCSASGSRYVDCQICSVPPLEFITYCFCLQYRHSTSADAITIDVKSSCGASTIKKCVVFLGHGFTANTPLHNSITN